MAIVARGIVERAQRFPLEVPLLYLKSGMMGWLDGKTINISRTGILFRSGEKLRQGTMLDIRVHFSPRLTMSCQGLVVRSGKAACAVRILHYRIHRPAS